MKLSLKGWRTIAFNVALAAAAVFEYLAASTGIVERVISDPKQGALVVLGVSIVNVLLRFITTGPVGKKE